MTRWLCLLAIFPSLLAAHAAAADGSRPASGNVKWRCWYDQDVHITCLIDTISHAEMIETLPIPIPAIAQEIRRDFGPGRKFFIHIPLHTQPQDAEFTALLAKSTVCGSGPDCSVDFSMKPPTDAEMAALIENDLPVAGADGAAAEEESTDTSSALR